MSMLAAARLEAPKTTEIRLQFRLNRRVLSIPGAERHEMNRARFTRLAIEARGLTAAHPLRGIRLSISLSGTALKILGR